MKKLRHKEVKNFVQAHTAAKSQSWDLNPPSGVFRNMLFSLPQGSMHGIEGVGQW